MDRLESWKILLTVAAQRSFVRAARAHGCSPQAVTRAVAALEEGLGTRLLHRTTRSVSLTHEGARYVERARDLVLGFAALEASAGQSAEPTGSLVVAAPLLFGELYVAPIVRELLLGHPGVSIRLELLDRVVSLAEEGVDVAIRIGSLPDSALRARGLGEVRRVACASPSYAKRAGVPRVPAALADHECIVFTGTTPITDSWTFRASGQRETRVRIRPRLVANNARAAIDAALAGLGIVRVLSYQVDDHLRAGRLRPVLARFEGERVPVQLLQLPRPSTRVASLFADLATERLRLRLRGG